MGGLAGDAFSSTRSGAMGSVRCAHSEDKSSALAPLFGGAPPWRPGPLPHDSALASELE